MYDGSLVFDTQLDTKGFEQDAGKLNQIVSGLGVFQLLQQGFNMVTGSIDKAMGRIDTMEQFSRVMTTMTKSVFVTNAALAETTDIVTGTAYGLDYASRSVQNFVSRGMEVNKATETVRNWGDAVAFYGDGSNAAFSSVTEALSKMQTKGNVTMEHMEMLLNAGIPAIEMYADAMGIAASDVTNMMSKGELAAMDFMDVMNLAIASGTTSFPSLSGAAKQAGASWSATFDNMGAAITRGVQKIILAIDDTQEALDRPTMRDAIKKYGSLFEKSLNLIAVVIPPVLENIDLLTISVGGLMLAFGAKQALDAFTTSTRLAQTALVAADAAGQLAIPTLNAKAVAEARVAAMQKLGSAATEEQIVTEMASMGVISAKTFALGGMATGLSLSTIASGLLTAATGALTVAINTLLGPVGLVIAAGTLLTAGVVALVKWINAETKAYQEQSSAAEDLAAAQESYQQSADASAQSHKDKLLQMHAEVSGAKQLAAQIAELAGKENKSAADKALLASYIDRLNETQEGLNLTYSEEGDLLSLNTEQIEEYIDAKMAVEQSNALIARQNELYQESAQLQQNLLDLNEKQAELDAQLEDEILKQSEYNELMEQLNATREAYGLQEQEIAEQQKAITAELADIDTAAAQAVIENAEAAAAAEEQELQRRKDALASYTEAATDMFDRIETKSELSVAEMTANLLHNQEAVRQWAENLASLAQRGVNEGLLQQLRDAGPESAATVAELVSASDAELAALSDAFAGGASAATDALMTELGLPQVVNSGSEMVDDIAQSARQNAALKDATVNMVDEAHAAAKSRIASANFPSLGNLMADGIAQGVISGTSGIVNAMISAVEQAVGAAKSKAQIHSPSRLFRDLIGMNMMRGWAQGVEDGQPLVAQGVEETVTLMERAAQSFSVAGLLSKADDLFAKLQLGVLQSRPQPAFAGAATSGTSTVTYGGTTTNLYQTINTHDSLSPSEMTREAQDLLARAEWRLP